MSIGKAKIPVDFQVVNEENMLLGIDWFLRYNVKLDILKRILVFENKNDTYQTYVKYKKTNKLTINYIIVQEKLETTEELRQPRAE